MAISNCFNAESKIIYWHSSLFLAAKFVSEAHFGGFMSQTDIEFAEGRGDNRQNWIDTIIAESKKRKAERQKDAEETDTKTLELNDMWKSVFGELKMTGQVYHKDEDKKKGSDGGGDSYDVLMRELTFEKGKAQATERTKTDEEVVQEERDRLEKLEAERIKRMKGEIGGGGQSDQEEDEKDKEEMGVEEESEGEEGEVIF